MNMTMDYPMPHIFSAMLTVMRAVKVKNPGDLYFEAYRNMIKKCHDKDEEFFDLYMLLRIIGCESSPESILEIGTRTGISLCQLLSAYPDPGKAKEIVSIDPFGDGYANPGVVRMNLRLLGLPYARVEFIEKPSKEVYPDFIKAGRWFDLIIVDGSHDPEDAKIDLVNAHELVKKGGTIVFDDISEGDGNCGLLPVWEEFKRNCGEAYEYREMPAGKGVAWAVRR